MIKRGLAEFLGSFFICVTVALCSVSPHPEFTAIATGLLIAAMVYATGHISGAHFNPVVSIAMLIRGKMQAGFIPLYIISQLFGAVMASAAVMAVQTGSRSTGLDLSQIPLQAMLAELIGTFGLVYVFLNVATSRDTQGNDYYGLAVGMVYFSLSMAFGHVSGGALNPAIALLNGITNQTAFSNLWILWLGEFTGGVLAAVTFIFIKGKD